MESRICGVASLDVYEMGGHGKLGLSKISGPMQHHFNHFSKVLGEIVSFIGCSPIFWGSDKGPCGQECAAWPRRM